MYFAMWLQNADLANTNHLIMIFIGLVAVAMAVMAIALIVVAITAAKAIKKLQETADEVKVKALPLIDIATQLSKTGQAMLSDVSPKVKTITDNLVKASDTLVEVSKSARATVQQVDATITDVNMRTQRQVARVDGMVSAALTTTAEVAETITNGIKVPAQKVAAAIVQAKYFAEGLLAKFKSKVDASPFGSRNEPE